MAKGKKTEEAQNEDVVFETMPGADKLSEDSEQSLDMNFGLGEEEKEEETEVEETTAEKSEEETTQEPDVEETVEPPLDSDDLPLPPPLKNDLTRRGAIANGLYN